MDEATTVDVADLGAAIDYLREYATVLSSFGNNEKATEVSDLIRELNYSFD